MASDLNEAIPLFLGYGTESFPYKRMAPIVARFGNEKASELKTSIDEILKSLNTIHIDWKKNVSVGQVAAQEIRSRFPELDEIAIQALVWKFAFDWR